MADENKKEDIAEEGNVHTPTTTAPAPDEYLSSEAGSLLARSDDIVVDEKTLPADPNEALAFFRARYEGHRIFAPYYREFLSSYAGSEVFVIDGDSLLGYLFDNSLLAWTFDSTKGAQFLHLFYLVEKFLKSLQDRGAYFRIVFFESGQALWSGSKGLARRILLQQLHQIRKLQEGSPRCIEVDVLPGVWSYDSPAWKDYIDLHKPIFILLKFSWREMDELRHFHASAQSLNFVSSAIDNDLGVVIIDEIKFDGSRAFAFSVTPRVAQLRKLVAQIGEFTKKHFSEPLLQLSTTNSSYSPQWEKLAPTSDGDIRVALTLAALEIVLRDNKNSADLAKVYLLHLGLLNQLSLVNRAFDYNSLPPTTLLRDAPNFVKQLLTAVDDIYSTYTGNNEISKLLDFADPRLFYVLLAILPQIQELPIESSTIKQWEYLTSVLPHLEGEFKLPIPDEKDNRYYPKALNYLKSRSEESASITTASLSSVSCELVNSLISPGYTQERFESYENAEEELPTAYDENIKNWNARSDFIEKESDPLPLKLMEDEKKSRKKELIEEQKAQKANQQNFEYLLVGSVIKRQKIFPDTKEEREEKKKQARKALREDKKASDKEKEEAEEEEEVVETSKKPKAKKDAKAKAKKGNAKGVSKKTAIIEKNITNKKNSNVETQKKRLDALLLQLRGDPNLVPNLREFAKKCDVPSVALTADLYALKVINKKRENAEGRKQESYTKQLFMGIQDFLRKYHLQHKLIEGKVRDDLEDLADSIGFDDLAAEIKLLSSSKPTKGKKRRDTGQKISAIKYQLYKAGENLFREVGTHADSRVPFIPDDWQRKLLNIVDADESAIICAPTSSGKTFICFYAMEHVLRAEEGVVVYVSPTKYLVNQIATEVSARYERDLPPGTTLMGFMNKDYEKNTTNCKVLVTIPECLDQLLFSLKDPNWSQKIKYVIFDEVHCIGASEVGAIWEELLLMVNCPILALSATISNFEQIYDWLAPSVQARGGKLHQIVYNHRYNDLQPFVYHDTTDSLVPLHPLWAINLRKILQEKKLPSDLKFLPEHCVELVAALKKFVGNTEEVKALIPENYFANVPNNTWNISMGDCIRYEADIKKYLLTILLKNDETGKKVIEALGSKAEEAFKNMSSYTEENVVSNLLALLRKLDKSNMLPALVFHLDRDGCEFLAKGIYDCLVKEEQKAHIAEGTLEKLNRLNKEVEAEGKMIERLTRDLKEEERMSQQLEDRIEKFNDMKRERDQLLSIDPRFAFLPKEGGVTREELIEILRLKGRKVAEVDKEIYSILQRGIGIHHPALGTKYRQAVERLFRMRKIKLVITTATLALGINMPCRTVVIAEDSPELNSLNYRQMSGRAGRRGFDLRGNIVFFDITQAKVRRLMTSNLPELLGNSIVSINGTLRSQSRYCPIELKDRASNDQELFAKALRRIIDFPLFKPEGADLHFSEHQYRVCIDYLTKEGYIEPDGTPFIFPGLTTQLSFVEPSNLVFMHLLKSGIFDQILTEQDPKRVLTTVMSNLFCRLPVHKSKVRTTTSAITLPPLPDYVKESIEEYNQRLVNCVAQYVNCYAHAYSGEWETDDGLPLSKIAYRTESETPSVLEEVKIVVNARSPFVALSGHTDKFNSSQELLESTRSAINLYESQIPVLDTSIPLNSYIVNFMEFEKMSALRDQMVPVDILYDQVKLFGIIARYIRVLLENRVANEESNKVLKLFATLHEAFPLDRFKRSL